MNFNDDIVMTLDYKLDNSILANSTEERFTKLFDVKSKWNREEMQAYMQDFIVGDELDKFLLRNAKSVKEQNPFDPSQTIISYMKKFWHKFNFNYQVDVVVGLSNIGELSWVSLLYPHALMMLNAPPAASATQQMMFMLKIFWSRSLTNSRNLVL